ncbi:MAG: hypothetical protein J7647_09885 [Cyanobacteria bacterium SBLK]|nr:hypothetical protein [Cyanobacteria bacterium SBLK]
MTEHSPSRMEELMAGFVMGNLSPEEAEEFHHLLARDPSLVDDRDLLQEILECLPYGLPEEEPPPQLRETILQRAERPPLRLYRSPNLKVATGAIAALLVLVLGIDNYRLRRMVSVQTSVVETGTIALAPEAILANQWYGLSELTEDHVKVAKHPKEESPTIQELAKRFDRELDLTLPVTHLDREELTFMSGSLCSLAKTKGVRLTYKLDGDRPLSFYQLARPKTATYPHPGSGRLYVNNRDRPAIVLWEDEQFLYALVADAPQERLDRLAEAIVESQENVSS